jgi:hypothetical protein
MSPLEDLKAARELISDPSRWTQGAAARNDAGNETNSTSPDATCFCSLGAITKVVGAPGERRRVVKNLLREGLPEGHSYIAVFNDTHTHEEVLAVFDRAIAHASV